MDAGRRRRSDARASSPRRWLQRASRCPPSRPLWIALAGRGALSEQAFRALCHAIRTGTLGASARLPPSRALAAGLGVSRNTVVLAYEQLLAEGYVQARVGSGTYVATELPESARGLVGPEATAPARPEPTT